jgi:lipid A 3-O-deacylase
MLKRILLAAAIFAAAPSSVHAQSPSRVGIAADNDIFATFSPSSGTDYEYTHGARLWLESPRLDVLPRVFGRILDCAAPASCRHRIELGQTIYTPRREADAPIRGERPHAGSVYLGVESARHTPEAITTIAAQVGMVGPPALGEHLQTRVHRWFGFRTPRGWEHQLPFEPTLQLRVARHADAAATRAGIIGAAAGYDVQGDVGNALTAAAAGVAARLCIGGVSCSGARTRGEPAWGFVARGSAGSRFVARDVFLDGTLRSSHSVEKRHVVPVASAGFALHMHRVTLEYERFFRGREYRTEPAGFAWGAIRIDYLW